MKMNSVLLDLFFYRKETQILVGLYGTCKELFSYLNSKEKLAIYGKYSFYAVADEFCKFEILLYPLNGQFCTEEIEKFIKLLYVYNFDFTPKYLFCSLKLSLRRGGQGVEKVVSEKLKTTAENEQYEELKIWLQMFYEICQYGDLPFTLENSVSTAKNKSKVDELVTEVITKIQKEKRN